MGYIVYGLAGLASIYFVYLTSKNIIDFRTTEGKITSLVYLVGVVALMYFGMSFIAR
jgi:hypothetical protein